MRGPSAPHERLLALLDDPGSYRFIRAPGRVNLMGDHTDYNDGLVLPMAIDLDCVAASRPLEGERLRVRSVDVGAIDTVEIAIDGSDEPAEVEPPWGRLVAGVVRALVEQGNTLASQEVVMASDVPMGSGLSSSAAFAAVLAMTLAPDRSPTELAVACQDAERLATGVPCGVMDPLVSLTAEADHASLIDCRSLTSLPVPFPESLRVLVVHSGVERRLEDTPYAARRAHCERVAADLGVASLRDLPPEPLPDDPVARHVVSENARTGACSFALAADARETLGDAFAASQRSLRDDFGCSTREIDALVDHLVDSGAIGARLTGAGWGGCVVALVDAEGVADLRDSVADHDAWICRPGPGAASLEIDPETGSVRR